MEHRRLRDSVAGEPGLLSIREQASAVNGRAVFPRPGSVR